MPDAVTDSHPSPTQRLDALDALRGFAILTMALSGLVPRGSLPAWMYHAQLPPPEHVFDPSRPGLTWVDLVFPFFLFSLGAAIPLALTRRLRAGATNGQIVQHALRRGVLLLGFAIYVQHINPWWLSSNPGAVVWGQALLGFALLFPIFTRLPRNWPGVVRAAIRVGGFAGAVILCATLRYPADAAFDPLRSDIIIVVLANVAVYGTLIWLLTRARPAARCVILLLLVAFRLGHESAGWVHDVWNLRFLPEVVRPYAMAYAQPYFLQYLHIVLPGTIIGDLLRRRIQATPAADHGPRSGVAITGVLGLVLNVLIVVGLQARWLPGTPLLALALCAIGLIVIRTVSPRHDDEVRLFGWATVFLAIGLVLEPYEGGIRKDHSTLSYYYVTAGLATFGLLTLMAAQRWLGRGPLAILIDSGQNPMIAYVGIRNLVPPVLGLLALIPPMEWLFAETRTLSENLLGPVTTGLLRAILLTLLVGLGTMLFTRLRVHWRT